MALSCASSAFLQRLLRPPTKVSSVAVSDVEAFAKAMQNNAKSDPKEGDTKDKKDEEEDMSLD